MVGSPFSWQAEDLNASGVVGDASKASVEKGMRLIEHQANAFIDLCWDVHRFPDKRLWKE